MKQSIKKLVFICLIFCMIGMGIQVQAAEENVTSGTCGTELTWNLADGVLTISGTGSMTDYTSGSSPWYQIRANITSVVVEDGVTRIGSYAFANLRSLKDVTLPDTLTAINSYGFYNCTISEANLPDGIKKIGKYAFSQCTKLGSVSIPGGLTSIEGYTFSGCSKLTSVSIPDSVTSIGGYAFSGCSSLTSVSIPDSVTSIGGSAFSDCSSLTSVSIPGSVTSIGQYTFADCSSLKSVSIPDSVTSIGGSAFSGCSSLTSVSIPDSVTSIGGYAFFGCSSLTSVNIPGSVTSIGQYTFVDCSSLKSVSIPDSVTTIGDLAFSGCSSLTSVSIPDSVASIGDSAFSGCSSLTSVSIPDSVTSIGDKAFAYNNNLEQVHFDGDVPNVGKNTFSRSILIDDVIFGYYPSNNSTWQDVIKGTGFGGGEFRWVAAVGNCPHKRCVYNDRIETPATCTEDGCVAKIKWCTDCYREVSRTNIKLPALGHDWDIPVITFSEDGKAAEAEFCCKNDETHTYTMDATVVGEISTPATCTDKGTTKYTATAKYQGISGSAVKYVKDLEMINTHTWKEPVFTFSEDGKSAQAIFYCKNDETHTHTMDALVTCATKVQPTCSNRGTTEYTATAEYEGVIGTATTELTDIPELEHSWDDGVVTVTPNTEHDGVITYTCSVCQIIRTEVLPKLQDANNSGTKHPAGNTGITDTVNNNASTGTAGNTANSTNNTETDTGAEDIQVGSVITEDSSDVKYKVITIGRNPAVECVRTTDKNLKNLVIPSSVTIDGVNYKVTAIADNAFKNCKKLTTVRIGTNVSRIGKRAFNGCKNLKSVKINSKKLTKKSIGTSAFKGISSKAVIKVPKRKLKTYKSYLKKSGVNGKKQTIKKS